MKVSVIVPNYNHAKYLRERIESILSQTNKDFELIILDDASTDNSREIILEYAGKFPAIITSFNEQNSGNPGKQWNRGVQLSSGEFIWIAESDDFAEPDFLRRTVLEIMKSEKNGLVYCDTVILDEQKSIKYRFSDKMNSGKTVKLLTLQSFVRNPIPNVSSVLFRKNTYLRAGGADTSMKFCGDWLLYMKIRKSSDVVYIPEPLSTFRLHENSRYHLHYSNWEYLNEKVKVLRYLIKESGFRPLMFFMVLKSIMISFCLQTVCSIKLPASLTPVRPRTPGK
ncbi:MAG: glycosyltransferase, partial [Methanococcaceae archaeon]